mmetsp:Transcript_17364/g.36697  ORF Transcript_17364/g.36697 Transcript_17364/m.36697 type:complete len:140 (-) Transcript_17364:770-1189(-)
MQCKGSVNNKLNITWALRCQNLQMTLDRIRHATLMNLEMWLQTKEFSMMGSERKSFCRSFPPNHVKKLFSYFRKIFQPFTKRHHLSFPALDALLAFCSLRTISARRPGVGWRNCWMEGFCAMRSAKSNKTSPFREFKKR